MNLSTTIVIFFATLIFAWVCLKRRDLFSWLFAYISSTLSEVFRLFSQEQYDTFEIISISFSALTVSLFIIAVSHEYYRTFSKTAKKVAIPMILLFFQQQITSLGLQITITFLLLIAMFLIIRIYLKKKTPTHAFMCFILSTGLLQVTASIIRDQGYPGADELLEFSRIVMATVMLITGVVAVIEDRIVRSENKYRLAYNRAEFYKDLFVHDINNILQNLEFSLEIISQVFRIILNNSIRYNDNPEVQVIVKIALEQEEGVNYVRMDFMDNGTGMPDIMKENIFYKIYEKPKIFKRIGLGLLLVREIVQSFNGKVWAEDRVKGDYKKGTNIIILIPETH
jgi:anti-sigma regulatory factor (Ser/Thr protein kinase)